MLSYPSAAFRASAPRGTVLKLWDGKDIPSGLNVGAVNGRLSLSKASLGNQTAIFPDADIEVQGTHEVVQSSWTARNHGLYTAIASATVTDPSTPAAGHEFTTLVRNGTLTTSRDSYSVSGTLVRSVWHSGSWTDYPYGPLNAANTWTAAQTFSADTVHRGIGGAPSLAFSATQIRADGYRIINSSAAVDNRIWDTVVSGTSLIQRSVNDAYGSAYPWVTVNRSGTNVTEIRFDATIGVGIGVTPAAGNGLLQFQNGTTKANGALFGDVFFYRSGVTATTQLSEGAAIQHFWKVGAHELFAYVDSGGAVLRSTGALNLGANGADRVRVKTTGQIRFVPLSADPSGAETGDVYYNSTTNKLRVYNGAWVDLH